MKTAMICCSVKSWDLLTLGWTFPWPFGCFLCTLFIRHSRDMIYQQKPTPCTMINPYDKTQLLTKQTWLLLMDRLIFAGYVLTAIGKWQSLIILPKNIILICCKSMKTIGVRFVLVYICELQTSINSSIKKMICTLNS